MTDERDNLSEGPDLSDPDRVPLLPHPGQTDDAGEVVGPELLPYERTPAEGAPAPISPDAGDTPASMDGADDPPSPSDAPASALPPVDAITPPAAPAIPAVDSGALEPPAAPAIPPPALVGGRRPPPAAGVETGPPLLPYDRTQGSAQAPGRAPEVPGAPASSAIEVGEVPAPTGFADTDFPPVGDVDPAPPPHTVPEPPPFAGGSETRPQPQGLALPRGPAEMPAPVAPDTSVGQGAGELLQKILDEMTITRSLVEQAIADGVRVRV